MTLCTKNSLIMFDSENRAFCKLSNGERIVKIFRLEAALQLFVYQNASTVKISKVIVVPLQRLVLDRKMTLRTHCSYEHYLWNGAQKLKG